MRRPGRARAEPLAVRPESAADHRAVQRLLERAFEGPQEASLVARLRPLVRPLISLVAVEGERVVGHILFTPVTIVSPGGREWSDTAVGLGPMAVLPERQRRGIGSRLVDAGLAACRAAGRDAVVVIGHPTYYPRFGFGPAGSFGLRSELEVPAEAFMALELRAGALAARPGTVRFHPAFGEE